ncbi:hypothetical protein [Streptomyces corynorhini]|uniref:hypothetical protein n=1 Tax=Streptomyces corynorhini TaxID=2282652 RepID=UPI0018F3E673|nr:hypothetical protein [Streptomyces corynorhini]
MARCLRCANDGLQTATALSSRRITHHTHKEKVSMNVLTNLLAGIVHFVGWLV